MDNTFTTGLYIFSSLIQADAAILGLGAVFMIYRLQSIYSQEQSFIDILYKSQTDSVKQACDVMIEGDPLKMDDELKKFKNNPRYFKLLKFLSEKHGFVAAAKTGFIPSLILVAFHCFLSAACLWWMGYMYVSQVNRFVQIGGAIITVLFGVILIEMITASQVALDAKPFIRFFPLGSKIIWKQS